MPRAAATLLSTLDEGVVIQAVDGAIVYANGAAERILGLTAAQLEGRTSLDPGWQAEREDGTEWPGSEHPIMEAIESGAEIDGSIMNVRHGNGTRVWISINARPLREDGDIVGGVATFRDITKERAAAGHASANERQLLEALHDSGLAVATSDAEGTLTTVNERFASMVGRDEEDLIGVHITEFSGPAAFDDQLKAVEQLRRGEIDQYQTFKSYVRPDGSLRLARMILLALRGPGGRVLRHVSLVQDMTEQIVTEATLILEARTDSLTGVLNRRGVLDALDHALADPGKGVLVAFVDLDGFKLVNDRHGHEVGDHLLIELTATIEASLRDDDTIGRLGGDEFVVILSNTPPTTAGRLRATLEEAVAKVETPSDDLRLGASIGIVSPKPDETGADVLRRADAAMYEEKRKSKQSAD